MFTEKQFHQKAISMGLSISPQGLVKRLDESCVEYLRTLLEQMVKDAVGFEEQEVQGLLERFSGVYIGDSTVLSLPEDFIDIYPGCGGTKGANAALKVQVNYDLKAGEMQLALQAGKAQDRSSPLLSSELPKAALDLHDLGYFNLARFKRIAEQDAYFLSRYRMGSVVFYQGQEVSLYHLLKRQKAAYAEFDIELGRQARLRCRLVAHKLPKTIAEQRRQRLHKEAKAKGQVPSPQGLLLADWTIFVTNVPDSLLSAKELMIVARMRWQIELIFKLWKSYGALDKSRSQKAWRRLCEIYAKLIGLLLQHWCLITSAWDMPDKSLVQAAQVIRDYALLLFKALDSLTIIRQILSDIRDVVQASCHINKRKSQPSAFQLWSFSP